MSKKYLGSTLDIHMGGIEHVPVHHTNEIAQSEAANGADYVKYWLHNEHLQVNSGKMSKSEGTSFSLADIKEKGYDPMDLRYFYLSAHYRSKLNFTWEALDASKSGLKSVFKQIGSLGKTIGLIDLEYQEKFEEALADDFNTPKALAVMQEALKSDLSDPDKLATLIDFDRVLGLGFRNVLNSEDLPKEVFALKEQRDQARSDKNWAESDRLRDEIGKLGYEVEDTKEGTKISKK